MLSDTVECTWDNISIYLRGNLVDGHIQPGQPISFGIDGIEKPPEGTANVVILSIGNPESSTYFVEEATQTYFYDYIVMNKTISSFLKLKERKKETNKDNLI